MKYIFSLIWIVWIVFLSHAFWYEQQWFSQYEERLQGISFSCTQQCFILLWNKWDSDSITIQWIEGQWQIVAVVLDQNGQLIPLSQQNLSWEEYVLSLSSPQKIPSQAQIWILFIGTINAVDAKIILWSLSFWWELSQWWKLFWINEWQTFYGINLRYGQKVWSWSIVEVSYFLCIIVGIILLFSWRRKKRNILYIVVVLYLLIAIRNQIDHTKVTIDGLNSYSWDESWSKTYGNLWDFYEFVEGVRNTIWLDEWWSKQCNIYYECSQPWPYCAHMESVFMKPCDKVETIEQSDYQIYYKTSPATRLGNQIFELEGSSLYQTK